MRGGCCMFVAAQSVISWPIGEFSRLSKCEARLLRTPLVPTGVAGQIKKKIGRRYSYTQLDSQQVWVWGEQEEQESWSWLFESLASLWAAEASLLQARVRAGVGVGVGGFQSSHPCLHQSSFAGEVCWFCALTWNAKVVSVTSSCSLRRPVTTMFSRLRIARHRLLSWGPETGPTGRCFQLLNNQNHGGPSLRACSCVSI